MPESQTNPGANEKATKKCQNISTRLRYSRVVGKLLHEFTNLFRLLLLFLVTGSAIVGIAGCATSSPVNSPQTLLGAGFRGTTPETTRQKEIFASLPADKVERLTVNNQTLYIYKDESKGMALVGGEAEHQRYREMARQDRLAEGQYAAAQMDDALARSWSRAYGMGYWR